ncbi:MAG: RES family NAD+ phosphorylase [Actinomycetota bacterium]|nr:RES family NAD+ phosphorylase [Actinomycetota bacterium]
MKGFPRRTLRADRTLFRIHKAVDDAWWFSSSGEGRFDPVGSGQGACYLAETPLGAWVETFRRQMTWSEAAILGRGLFVGETGRELRLADLTSRRALQFGVTATVSAGEDYHASQAFAANALVAGFDGLRYWVRHDPRQNLAGVALFAPAGTGTGWPSGRDGPISDQLIQEAATTYGYRIVPRP